MCGRFVTGTDRHDWRRWVEALELTSDEIPTELPEAFTPAATIPIFLREGASVHVGPARWGLAPSWMAKPLAGRPLINVRSETAGQKFGRYLGRSRCVIPATGFWVRRDDVPEASRRGGKGRLFVRVADHGLFGFAGLFAEREHEGGLLRTCAILTTESSPAIHRFHDRMPVVLEPEAARRWLDPATPYVELMRLCAAEVALELAAA